MLFKQVGHTKNIIRMRMYIFPIPIFAPESIFVLIHALNNQSTILSIVLFHLKSLFFSFTIQIFILLFSYCLTCLIFTKFTHISKTFFLLPQH